MEKHRKSGETVSLVIALFVAAVAVALTPVGGAAEGRQGVMPRGGGPDSAVVQLRVVGDEGEVVRLIEPSGQ